MLLVVCLVSRFSAGVAKGYADKIKEGIEAAPFSFSAEVVIENGPVTGKNNVVIRVLAPNGGVSGYPSLANDAFDTYDADVIVTADSVATTYMREKRGKLPSFKKDYKAVVAAFSAAPDHFEHCADLEAPENHVTGILVTKKDLNKDRLKELRKIVPNKQKVGIIRRAIAATGDAHLDDVTNFCAGQEQEEIKKEAQGAGFDPIQDAWIVKIDPNDSAPFDKIPADLGSKLGIDALIVIRDPYFVFNRIEFVKRINATKLPTIYPFRDFVEAGGLISHGPDRDDGLVKAGGQVAAILDKIQRKQPAEVTNIKFKPPKTETVIMVTTFNSLSADGVNLKDIASAIRIP